MDAEQTGPTRELIEYIANRSAHQIAAHRRNDAEAAAMIATFGYLQVSVMPRRQLYSLRRHQVCIRIMFNRLRQVVVNLINYLLIGLGAGYTEHLWMRGSDNVGLGAEAAGYDDLAIFMQRFTNCV